jgi:6-pyruvoyltetrahydropterin/6-carboxytetrahydropterin synthase
MVMDFGELKARVVRVCAKLDHKVLLPNSSKYISIEKKDSAIHVNVNTKHYEFPAEDCVVLPIKATTAELLAEYIAKELIVPPGYEMEVCVGEDIGSRGCFKIS